MLAPYRLPWFSPALLDALELSQDIQGEPSARLCALQMLMELNATARRKLSVNAPTELLPQRFKPIVINHGEIDRRAWECALLLKLRDELKAGNLSVSSQQTLRAAGGVLHRRPPLAGYT